MSLAGFKISFEPRLMEPTNGSRHEIRERFADKLFRVVSKYPSCCGVCKNDNSILVDTDHRIAGCFNHNPVSCFAALKFVLGMLSVVDVGDKAIPSGYSSFCVSHGSGAILKPPIDAIGPTTTVLRVIRCSGGDRICECQEDAWHV